MLSIYYAWIKADGLLSCMDRGVALRLEKIES